MMEELNTKLSVKMENGNSVEIDVIDIIEAPNFNKEFIIYTFPNTKQEEYYASILTEDETSFSLDTIESDEEIEFVNKKIQEIANAVSMGE